MNNKSFTVIELLVVIAIIGVLASIVLVSLSGTRDRANIAKTLLYSNQVYHALGADIVGNWNLDEGSGSTALDSSGSNRNGAISGASYTDDTPYKAAGQGSGKYALSFDGVDDYVLLSSSINLGNTNWTLTAWVKTGSSGRNTVLSNSSGGPVANDICVYTSKICYIHYDGIWKQEYGTSNVADNRWHFLTWVNYSNQTIDLYVDGVRETTGASSTVANYGPVNQIGRNWFVTASGYLDDIRVYSQSLTASEIRKQYVQGALIRSIALK
jgi:prepilin-type N-terminal cleavage/methylation domain-containing protein